LPFPPFGAKSVTDQGSPSGGVEAPGRPPEREKDAPAWPSRKSPLATKTR
jgi:hypothetical protein